MGIVYNITPNTYRNVYNAIRQIITVEGVNIDHVVLQRIVPVGRALNNMKWSLKQLYINEIFTQMEQIEKEFLIDVYLEASFPLCAVPKQYRHFVCCCQWGTSGISIDLYKMLQSAVMIPDIILKMFLNHLYQIFREHQVKDLRLSFVVWENVLHVILNSVTI